MLKDFGNGSMSTEGIVGYWNKAVFSTIKDVSATLSFTCRKTKKVLKSQKKILTFSVNLFDSGLDNNWGYAVRKCQMFQSSKPQLSRQRDREYKHSRANYFKGCFPGSLLAVLEYDSQVNILPNEIYLKTKHLETTFSWYR